MSTPQQAQLVSGTTWAITLDLPVFGVLGDIEVDYYRDALGVEIATPTLFSPTELRFTAIGPPNLVWVALPGSLRTQSGGIINPLPCVGV